MLVILMVFVTFAAFTIQRLVFLFWNWSFFRQQSAGDLAWALLSGLRFDAAAIALLAAIPFLLSIVFWRWRNRLGFRRALFAVFVGLQLPGLVFSLGDSEYVNYTGRRLTYDALFNFREVPGKFFQITFSYWPLFVISSLTVAGFIWLCWRLINKTSWEQRWERGRLPHQAIKLFVVFLIIAVAARGGLQKKPLGFAHAQIFHQPMMNNLVLNSTFTFIQTLKRQSLPRVRYFDSQNEMLAHLNGHLPGPSLMEGHRPAQAQNVVVIILESFSLEHMGKAHLGQGYTPFLDSLAEKGIFFENHFANGRRSIEGVGAILAGIPALMAEPFLSSQYMSNYFLGLGTLLTKQKYHTSFFHGGANGTFYFDSFIHSLGIPNYFGSFEYPEPADNDGTWGIFDEPFLKWMVSRLNSFPQPFFSAVFTLTSHNPFRIPEKYVGRFPKGTAEIHEVIGYTDFAVSEFFREAEKQPWYGSTLFVITADHTSKAWRPGFDNEIEQHHIPLILFHPTQSLPRPNTHQLTQQIDLLPTILDYLGLEQKERNYLARSVFVPGDRTVTILVDGRYHLIGEKYFLKHETSTGDFQLFSRADSNETTPLSEPANLREEYILRLKASMQYFSQGLWDNKIYYPTGR